MAVDGPCIGGESIVHDCEGAYPGVTGMAALLAHVLLEEADRVGEALPLGHVVLARQAEVGDSEVVLTAAQVQVQIAGAQSEGEGGEGRV